MKKLLIFFLLLASSYCYAQDVLYFHNGQTAKGKVTEVSDACVKFCYAGEDFSNTIGKNALSKIEFASGRVQEMSQKIEVNSEKDWEKVKVVSDKNEVMGLKSIGQVEKHSSGTWSFSITAGHFGEKTLKKVRKEAAKKGACFVLILSQSSESGGLFKNGHASMTGEMYSY